MNPSSSPAPPWTLRGHAIVVPVRVPRDRVHVPAPLAPVSVARFVPGVIIGARYGSKSTLVYNELAVLVPVRAGFRFGVHVTAIWVDDRESRAAGREVWGLPKEMATFRWSAGEAGVVVRAAGTDLARIAVAPAGPAVPMPVRSRISVLGVRDGRVERFRVSLRGRVRRGRLRSARDGAWPAGARPLGAIAVRDLEAIVHAPQPLG